MIVNITEVVVILGICSSVGMPEPGADEPINLFINKGAGPF
jgi:hypothetical protein